jgi:FkbM family methyltransferase
MLTHTVVTSFNKQGYEQCGEQCIETFIKHWPNDIKLRIYSEDMELDSTERIKFTNLYVAQPDLKQFKKRNAHRKVPGYRLDAVRFAHKVFAIIDAAKHCKTDRLIWLDADTLTHAPIPRQFVEDLLPHEFATACLLRPKRFSECGFVVYNLNHKFITTFLDYWHKLYATDKVYNLAEWHDSYIYDQLRIKFNLPTKNLSNQELNDNNHPFINSDLGKYMDHFKGKRKGIGQSTDKDLLIDRPEQYWKEKRMNSHMGFVFPPDETHLQTKMQLGKDGVGRYQYDKLKTAIKHCTKHDLAIDIGSHVGLWSRHLVKFFDHVEAFDVNPTIYQYFEYNLRKELEAGKIQLNKIGLSDKNEAGTIYCPHNHTGDATMLQPKDEKYKTIEGQMTTLDSFNFKDVSFIKIDVEGAEYYVLKGAQQTLEKYKPVIIVEQKVKNISRLPSDISQFAALEFLESLGAKRREEMSGDYIYTW